MKALRLQTLFPLSELSLFTVMICFLHSSRRLAVRRSAGPPDTPHLATSSRRQCCPCVLFCISSIFLCWEVAWVPFFPGFLYSPGHFFSLWCQAVVTAMPFLPVPGQTASLFSILQCFISSISISMSLNEFSLSLPHFCDSAYPFSLLIVVGLLFARLSALKFYLGDG